LQFSIRKPDANAKVLANDSFEGEIENEWY
jgi:hypothetical protein